MNWFKTWVLRQDSVDDLTQLEEEENLLIQIESKPEPKPLVQEKQKNKPKIEQKKIIIFGDFEVGKSSLIEQYKKSLHF